MVCVDNPLQPGCLLAADCPGICIAEEPPTYYCAGLNGLQCPEDDMICVDDPTKPGCLVAADCLGVCVKSAPEFEFCGGFAGLPCAAANYTCIDDPRDDCDPDNGGADCGGICVFSCGGRRTDPVNCPNGTTCVDNPLVPGCFLAADLPSRGAYLLLRRTQWPSVPST